MRGKWKLLALLFALGGVILLVTSLFDRRPAITVAFLGYTNDIFGLYTFGLFEVRNRSGSDLDIRQGPTGLKTPQGWSNDMNHVGYRLSNICAPGDQRTVQWLGPGTNCTWRANFEFIGKSVWRQKLATRLQRWGIRWHPETKTYIVTTSEIPPPN